MNDLSGKVFVVVGATGALGSRIAKLLAQQGASLTISGRSGKGLDALGIEGAHKVTADLREPDAARSVIAEAKDHHGRIDGVVIAAGIAAFGPVAEIDDDTVDDLVLVDFLAPLRLLRAALHVVDEGGVIVGISAVLAEQPVAGMATYSAVKAAVSTLFIAAAKEARRSKIRVVDVRPPHTETGLAGRAIAGSAPKMPEGLSPEVVADRVLAAIVGTDREVASTDFN
ncbi:SDR family NAD(P)-dependent oxidoreductase [Rhodococcus sp. PAMC28707]|uniref:SDR family NAD(P)-dependent oxidoreductase n=1 Tax=unclassified Rhodococcus (in: high G+C Gram-positive bacteria) TaxID=192944 RepID=UPI00109DD097|nr:MULTISPECIES: SDR family NAD(P)-dependent oxidoreductase [unclassified Rhodococcus (in: high G+C Gram-positive bacteria)]QCB51568.1 SDR family NAD(P)-dependent oxidoreductase [Rhodococcus sp. PAMC28705]QCB60264.1 SDR family NAD(P)-dependent oxidoreductase [Rhodococcus sp. PAMC28707]